MRIPAASPSVSEICDTYANPVRVGSITWLRRRVRKKLVKEMKIVRNLLIRLILLVLTSQTKMNVNENTVAISVKEFPTDPGTELPNGSYGGILTLPDS